MCWRLFLEIATCLENIFSFSLSHAYNKQLRAESVMQKCVELKVKCHIKRTKSCMMTCYGYVFPFLNAEQVHLESQYYNILTFWINKIISLDALRFNSFWTIILYGNILRTVWKWIIYFMSKRKFLNT